MRIFERKIHSGFTLAEMLVSVGCSSLILAAVVTAGVALQRSYAAVELYSNTEGDQLRVLDYIAMDCRRAIGGQLVTSTGSTLSTPAVDEGSWVNGTWTPNASGQTTLLLNLPVYYNSSGSNAAYQPTLATGGVLSYGSGTVTVIYQRSGNNFTREVVIKNSSGTVTSDNISTIAKNVASFTLTPIDQGSTNGTLSCNLMFFPTFLHNAGSGTWRSDGTPPDGTVGVNGDWWVIDTTASDPTTVGDVYYMSGGSYSKIQNVKATQVYCNIFLRNTNARQ